MVSRYSERQLKFIKKLRESGLPWDEVAIEYNDQFDERKTANAVRKAYHKIDDDIVLKTLKSSKTMSTSNSRLRKENKVILNNQLTLEKVQDALEELVQNLKIPKIKIPKVKKNPKKKNMTMEVLLSDIHIGKKSKDFNLKVAKSRLEEYVQVILEEVNKQDNFYNLEEIVLSILGDIIENSVMHGMESMSASEFENSEQVRRSIEMLFELVLVPLASTGKKITAICITGNHDRYGKDKTMNEPGKANLTWTIYKMLELLCQKTGLKNINFIIPEGVYATYQIYQDLILYEHGDNARFTEKDLDGHMNARSRQINKMISFFRLGHWHKHMSYDGGKIIANGSICGTDSYALIKGYHGDASQVINYYINTKKRPNSFYMSFPVFLG